MDNFTRLGMALLMQSFHAPDLGEMLETAELNIEPEEPPKPKLHPKVALVLGRLGFSNAELALFVDASFKDDYEARFRNIILDHEKNASDANDLIKLLEEQSRPLQIPKSLMSLSGLNISFDIPRFELIEIRGRNDERDRRAAFNGKRGSMSRGKLPPRRFISRPRWN